MNTLKETLDKSKTQIAKIGEHITNHPVPYLIGGLGIGCALGYSLHSKGDSPNSNPEQKQDRENIISSSEDRVAQAAEMVAEKTDSAVKTVSEKVHHLVDERPLLVASGVVATGFLAGLLIPLTNCENKFLGDKKKQFISRAKAAGHEALEKGEKVARETVEEVDRKVKQAAKQTGDFIREKVSSFG